MKVKELKEILINIPDELDIYAFNKKVDTYGIFNIKTSNGLVSIFKLKKYSNKNSFLEKLKFWESCY